VRQALLFLVVVVAVGVLVPALVARPSGTEGVASAFDDSAKKELRLPRACFGILRLRSRPRCERRGGVETRLGTVKIPRR
jgi:hypothetical protein